MDVDKDLLLVIESAGIGEGEPDLGERLMGSFLGVLLDSGRLPAAIVCMNSGIFLTTEGSPVLETLKAFEAAGSEVFSCGTCLDYYGRRERLAVGSPTTMKETVRMLLEFKKVLRP